MKDELLKQLDFIDKRMEQLKHQITDEYDNKLVVTSDPEFDDPNTDPRYERSKYRSKVTKDDTKKLEQSRPESSVKGLLKGHKLISSSISHRHEALQRERMEKNLKVEKQRKLSRSQSDTSGSISALNESLQKAKEAKKVALQREDERKAIYANEPFRPGFEIHELPLNFEENVVSHKTETGDKYNPENDPAFDKYSHMYVSKRYLPRETLDCQIGNTKVFRTKSLLAYMSLNDELIMETNFILVGMISYKSDPALSNDGISKYLRIRLTDFHFEILLLLQGDAYNKFWKLPVGSIIAVLNPEKVDSYSKSGRSYSKSANSFMFRITNSLSILEYARFRDFAHCRGNGSKKCSQVVDIKKSRYCDYHQEKRADKAASNRNEMGTNYRLFAPVDMNGNKQVMVVTPQQAESLELVQAYKENNQVRSTGLAIENVKLNPPIIQNKKMEMLIPDFSDPQTMENMKTEEERNRSKFSSIYASQAFKHSNRVNKEALHRQERLRELDKRLRKKMLTEDPRLMKRYEKARSATDLKRRKEKLGLNLKKELDEASKNEKSLKKDKLTVSALVREREEIEEQTKSYRVKKSLLPHNDNIDVAISAGGLEKEIQLSSDSESESDSASYGTAKILDHHSDSDKNSRK